MEENQRKSKINTVNNLSLESSNPRQNPVNLTVMVEKSSSVFYKFISVDLREQC